MPKKPTTDIQNFLVDLGGQLGFDAKKEYSFEYLKSQNSYCPVFDVVWFLEIDCFNTRILQEKYVSDRNWNKLLDKVPVATFEIEGSNTNSKYQVGNFANLHLNPSLYNFVIVNNNEARKEEDTYRRGIKIQRTIKEFMGDKNIFFADWSQIKNVSLDNSGIGLKNITIPGSDKKVRSGFGGEKKSIEVFDTVIGDFQNVGMSLKQNYTPEIIKSHYYKIESLRSIDCDEKYDVLLGKRYTYVPTSGDNSTRNIRSISSYYYLPRIDFVLGFNLPKLFVLFLRQFAEAIRDDIVNNNLLNYIYNKKIDELFFPYLGCEIETNSSKHLAGGIINCSNYFFTGLLISPIEGSHFLKTYRKNLGITNVFHYEYKF